MGPELSLDATNGQKRNNPHRTEDATAGFINPASIATPVIAAAIVTTITNWLWVQYEVPQKLTAPLMSLMCAGIVAVRLHTTGVFQKAFYTIFNALLICATAFGVSGIGGAIDKHKSDETSAQAAESRRTADEPARKSLVKGSDAANNSTPHKDQLSAPPGTDLSSVPPYGNLAIAGAARSADQKATRFFLDVPQEDKYMRHQGYARPLGLEWVPDQEIVAHLRQFISQSTIEGLNENDIFWLRELLQQALYGEHKPSGSLNEPAGSQNELSKVVVTTSEPAGAMAPSGYPPNTSTSKGGPNSHPSNSASEAPNGTKVRPRRFFDPWW